MSMYFSCVKITVGLFPLFCHSEGCFILLYLSVGSIVQNVKRLLVVLWQSNRECWNMILTCHVVKCSNAYIIRAVIKGWGPGLSASFYDMILLSLENGTKVEPKTIPSCLIPYLRDVFTQQIEILVTSLCYYTSKTVFFFLFHYTSDHT